MSSIKCIDGTEFCPICISERVCFISVGKSKPIEKKEHHESLHCPETGNHCLNPQCGTEFCLLKDYRERHEKTHSDRLFEELLKRLETASIFERKHEHAAEKLINIIADQVHVINNLTEENHHRKHHDHDKPIFGLTILINNQTFIMQDILLEPNTPKAGVFTLFDKNLAPIPGVTFSNQQIGANSNPEVATFAADPSNPNAPIGTPVATSGSGTIVFTTDAAYTAADGTSKTGSFTVTKNYSVDANGLVSFDVVFP